MGDGLALGHFKLLIKSFECPKSTRNYEKNNAWNIRHLVDELFVPASQRASISYCRLSDFKRGYHAEMKNCSVPRRVHIFKTELLYFTTFTTINNLGS